MRLPSAGAGSVYAGDRHVADVHYTLKRDGEAIKADVIVVSGEQDLTQFRVVTLRTKDGHAVVCNPEVGGAPGKCSFHINDLG